MREELFKLPIIGILRGIEEKDIKGLNACILNSGLKFVEVTMNTSGAASLISQFIKEASNNYYVGAGTVLTVKDYNDAKNAGAQFIVMPNFNLEIVELAKKDNLMVFPGALTPSEIYAAWNAGATMVKIFPTSLVGAKYFREIKGPFNNVKLLACGGVNSKNANEYLKAGADGIAFGSGIFKQEDINSGDYKSIEIEISKLIQAYKAYFDGN